MHLRSNTVFMNTNYVCYKILLINTGTLSRILLWSKRLQELLE
jgi:hypothetical protein